jgi:SAM-dependent methyltransferase
VQHESPRSAGDADYVLGTHDEEIGRLAIQHQAWRSRVLSVWQLAQFGPGQTLLDVGCGPGYASLDLARLVGPAGRVVALDRSKRFLDTLEALKTERGLPNISTQRVDLNDGTLSTPPVDGAWCRWVLTFVPGPRAVIAHVAAALKPGGVFVLHEYFDYSTWRTAPQAGELNEFVRAVVTSWRDAGGEPDVGLNLPQWLAECDLEIRSVRPIVEIIAPSDPLWVWLRTFLEHGRDRLAELGYLTRERSDAIWETFTRFEQTPGSLMVTPGVIELVAARR